MNLIDFLDKKGVEYAPFDPDRFREFYQNYIAQKKSPKIVQIVGTNGKGTTGRFLAQMLKNEGVMVGHFTSPHILSFTERFWFDGGEATQKELEESFWRLFAEFGELLIPLSYFEILTLLGFVFFANKADIVILEAGVGGEFDSTSVFSKELLLVTNIGFDHQEMLGNTLGEITKTKLRASNCKTIVGFQSNSEVYEIIKKEFKDKDIKFLDEMMSSEDEAIISEYARNNFLASYLAENLSLAYIGAKQLGVVAPKLDGVCTLSGRFEKIAPNVIVDVGHNELAAQRVASELGDKKVTLVFNCYADKDPYATLMALRQNIESVEIIDVKNDRIIEKEKLIKILDRIGVSYRNFDTINKNREYLVFGSFSVVAEFLRRGV